ncbi:MAG TPA: hypothetical protein VFP34_05740 [Microlunatus sp.]|nr:hypothetical protein [Microlunatus sp.]
MLALPLLETAAHELPIPAWGFGLIAFGLLAILMLITLTVGKGRPHA